MDKKKLSERDICTKYITPALEASKWDINNQIREELGYTLGRIHVRGNWHQEERINEPITYCITSLIFRWL